MKRKSAKLSEIQRYNPDPAQGLCDSVVKERLKGGLKNYSKTKTGKSYRAIIFSNLLTFFNLIWAIVAAILIWIGAYGDLFFLVIVSANTLVGIIQETKAKRTVERLTLMTAPQTEVVRDGQKMRIATTDIVLDDVMVLTMGNQVGADAVLLDGAVEVNESLLTGESVPVKKMPGDLLYAASFVTSGTCRARADKIGADSYVQRLSLQAKKLKEPTSQLMRSLRLIINVIGVLLLPLSALVFYRNQKIIGDIHIFENLAWAIRQSAGAVVGMIPSGMFLLTSVALAVGVINLGRKRTLVRDMYCIEMLARANVLCLDKTGTITDGTMRVRETVPLSKGKHDTEAILSSLMYATEDNNQTARAVVDAYGCRAHYRSLSAVSFSSARKYSAASFEKIGTYALGAPEYVLGSLSAELSGQINLHASQGLRVLLCAHSKKPMDGDKLPQDMQPVFLVSIEDNIRADAGQTIKWFNDNNVEVKIISGDNPVTVAEVAARAGVANCERLISLENLSDSEVYSAATQFTVFGRVSPEQKAVIIKALKNSGQTVAMTGDGVNDILSFREADCSVAMAAGSEATRNIANLVLLDSNFSAMPKVVEEGRRVINNIEKTSALFLMKTVFVLLLVTVLTMMVNSRYPYPFSPRQMIILETFVIGMPAFFLALQPDKNLIKGKFIHTIFKKALPPALLMFFNVLAVYLLHQPLRTLLYIGTGGSSALGFEKMVTVCIILTVFIGYIMLFNVCLPLNKYRLIMFVTMAVLGIGIMLAMPGFFKLQPLSWYTLAMTAAALAVDIPLFILFKFIINRVYRKFFDSRKQRPPKRKNKAAAPKS